MTEELSIKCSAGTFHAEIETPKDDVPAAIYLTFTPEGTKNTIDIACVREIENSKDIELAVWEDVEKEWPTRKIVLHRDDIKQAGIIKAEDEIYNNIYYEERPISQYHEHSLWYGGDVASFKYNGRTWTLRANGDVEGELTIKHSDGSVSEIEVKDRSCHAIFREKFQNYFYDRFLLKLLDGEPHLTDDGAMMTLRMVDNNWWEIFVTDSSGYVDSFVCDSEFYNEAIEEMVAAALDY